MEEAGFEPRQFGSASAHAFSVTYAGPPLSCLLLGLSSELLGLCFPLEADLSGQFSMAASA